MQDASSSTTAVNNFSTLAVGPSIKVDQTNNEENGGLVSNKRHTRTADGSVPDDFFDRFSEKPRHAPEVKLEPLPASFLDGALESKSAWPHTAEIASTDLESLPGSILLSVSVASARNVYLLVLWARMCGQRCSNTLMPWGYNNQGY